MTGCEREGGEREREREASQKIKKLLELLAMSV